MISAEFLLPSLLAATASYLIGSVSFSIIFTRIFAKKDVRQVGSGNAGMTNVLRAAGKFPAGLTFACDFIKCVAAICFSLFIFNVFTGVGSSDVLNNIFVNSNVEVIFIKFLSGLFCMIGHIYPLYFGFRGGKGVVTMSALVFMISWQAYIICMSIFLIAVIISRIVSLSALISVSSLPFATFGVTWAAGGKTEFLIANTLFALVMAAIIYITHIPNLKRLAAGTEPKFGSKNAAESKKNE
jgi:glycerol-3-phosphate acyltransferase PlsY